MDACGLRCFLREYGDVTRLDLAHDIRELVLRGGADFFGVADLAPGREAAVQQGGESLAQFPRAVVIGIALPDAIVDLLPQHESTPVAQRYKQVYDETNARLDEIAACVVRRLQTAGATALAVCASRRIDQERHLGLFSHKMAAHLAGLGWIGRSCLLITREAGPRVRWSTVLTAAPLPATGQAVEPACGECRRCVQACPAQALSGVPFRAEEHRDVRFAAQQCVSYREEMEKKLGCPVLCGLCVAVCPHGQRRAAQASNQCQEPHAGDSAADR